MELPIVVATIFFTVFSFTADAAAHTGSGLAGGFTSGFLHPVAGFDHIVAMIAVGLWGVFLGVPAIWLLPVVFPMVMALGGVLGIFQIPVPVVEILIALSAVVLGACVAFAWKPRLWIAAVLVGLFAIFHGYAHGAELPTAASPIAYSVGFVVATGMIHLIGIGLGLLTHLRYGNQIVRSLGSLIGAVGLLFLVGIL